MAAFPMHFNPLASGRDSPAKLKGRKGFMQFLYGPPPAHDSPHSEHPIWLIVAYNFQYEDSDNLSTDLQMDVAMFTYSQAKQHTFNSTEIKISWYAAGGDIEY